MNNRGSKKWAKTTINQVCELVNGHGFKQSEWRDWGLPIIRIQNLNGSNRFNYFDGVPDSRWIVEKGDILFAWAGVKGVSFGPCFWIGDRGVLNQHIFRVIPKIDLIDPFYLYLALRKVTAKIESKSHGFKTSFLHVNKKDVLKQNIMLPPLPEQQKITEILATWDEGIGKLERLVAVKKRQFIALALKTINDKAFPLKKIKDLLGTELIIEKGQAIQKTGVACGDIPVIAGGKQSPYFHNRATHTVPSITISASGANAGYIWFHSEPIWASDCIVVYTNSHLTQYVYYALKMQQEKVYALQSGGGQPHVYAKDLKKLSIPFPSVNIQRDTADKLSQFEQEIQKLEKSIQLYKIQKQALMQKLLSGEWNSKGV